MTRNTIVIFIKKSFLNFMFCSFLLSACGSEQAATQQSATSAPSAPGPAGSAGPIGPAGTAGESFRELHRKLLSQVKTNEGAVVNLLCNGASGTGTRIANDTVVTAFHVIDGATSCVVRANGLQVAVGGSFSRAPSGRDIGYVRGLNFNQNVPIIPITRRRNPLVGDLLVLLSYPGEFTNDVQTTFGFVTDDNAQSSLGDMAVEWRDAIISDMSAGGGSSGGAIFNEKNEFVGVHVGGFSSGSSAGLELNFQLIFSETD